MTLLPVQSMSFALSANESHMAKLRKSHPLAQPAQRSSCKPHVHLRAQCMPHDQVRAQRMPHDHVRAERMPYDQVHAERMSHEQVRAHVAWFRHRRC